MSSIRPSIIRLSEPQAVSMGDDWFNYARADHFWMKWRFAALKRILKPLVHKETKAMEIGCGNGIFREEFEKTFNVPLDGCDLNLPALERGFKGLGQTFVYDVFEKKEEVKAQYDIIFLLDVIEHVEDDVSFIEQCRHLLKPGGHLIINVPYGKALYSKYDEVVGHLRRYEKEDLERVSQKAGYSPLKTKTWGFFLLPISVLRKFVLAGKNDEKDIIKTGFEPPHAVIHLILHGLKRFEMFFPFFFPWGTSVIHVAKN